MPQALSNCRSRKCHIKVFPFSLVGGGCVSSLHETIFYFPFFGLAICIVINGFPESYNIKDSRFSTVRALLEL